MTLAIYRASLRLMWRSLWVWAVTLPMLAVVWLGTQGCTGAACAAAFFHQPFTTPFFLGQMLATIAFVHLDRTQRADETFAALPYRSGARAAGQAAAVYTVWLGAGSLLYFLAIALTARGGIDTFILFDWLMVMPLTLLCTTGVAYAIGTWMSRGFGAYLLTMLLFLAVSFPFNDPLSQIFVNGMGTGPLTILDVPLSSYFPLTGWPIFPLGWPLLFNRLFAVGLGVLGLGLAARAAARRRREGGGRAPLLTAVAAVTILALALTGNRLIWAQAVARMTMEWSSVATVGRENAAAVPAPSVTGYAINLTFRPDRQRLRAEANIEVQPAGDLAPFTLNSTFEVLEVTGPDGKHVPYARSGDLLLVTTQSQAGQYRVTYEGMVWQWRPDLHHGLRLAAHVEPASIMLPEGMAWYPVPGRQTILQPGRLPGVMERGLWHPPVPMKLTAVGAGDLTIVSNALEGRPVSRAWLIGTPWAPFDEGGIRFLASPGARGAARQFAADFGPALAFYQQLIPLQAPPQVIEVPAALWAVQSEFETFGFPGAIVASPALLQRMDGLRLHGHLASLWWSNERTREEGQVHDLLKLFMTGLYQPDRVNISLARVGGINGIQTEAGRGLVEQLRQFHHREGMEATGRLLRSLYGSPAPLTYADVARALKGELP